MIKRLFLFVFAFFCVYSAHAQLSQQQQLQHLTRFAVIDMQRVYTTFFRESIAVREFEQRSAAVQAEINRLNREIQQLQSRRLDLLNRGEREEALRLESEIIRRQEYAREYHTVKTAELEQQRRTLTQSQSFLEQVQREARAIAEREGYSMVLIRDNATMLWFSPSVDITDRVIQALRNRRR